MKRKRREVKRDNKIKVNLLITLVFIFGLINFLYLNRDFIIEESFADQNSFVSKCVEKLGNTCVLKLLRSPVIASDLNEDYRYKRLQTLAYKQLIQSGRARWTKWGWRCNKNTDCKNQKYKGEETRCRKKVRNRRFSSRYKYCLKPSSSKWQCGKGQCEAAYTCRRGQVRNSVTNKWEWWRSKNGKLGTESCRTPARIGWRCAYDEQCKSNNCVYGRCDRENLDKDPYQNLKLYGELINKRTKNFFAFLDKKYSRLNQDHQYDLIDAIDSGDKILRMSEKIVGKGISPQELISEYIGIENSVILVDKGREDEEPTRPGTGGGQGGGSISVGGSSGGGSGSTFLDCIKQSSGSVTPTPDVGGSPGGPVGTTPTGGQGTGEDPMTNSGLGAGIGKEGGELMCGPGGNIEGPKGGGLTQGDEEGTETPTPPPEPFPVETAKVEPPSQYQLPIKEIAQKVEKSSSDSSSGVTVTSVTIERKGAPSGPIGKKAHSGKTYMIKVSGEFYNPEPETSPAIEGGEAFEVDCGDGNVLLCMSSNNKGGGKGACYEAELDPYGLPDPNTIKPCGDDVPADAINFPDNYLVDPVPYLQQVQQQMGKFHTPMLFQKVYLKGNYDNN